MEGYYRRVDHGKGQYASSPQGAAGVEDKAEGCGGESRGVGMGGEPGTEGGEIMRGGVVCSDVQAAGCGDGDIHRMGRISGKEDGPVMKRIKRMLRAVCRRPEHGSRVEVTGDRIITKVW